MTARVVWSKVAAAAWLAVLALSACSAPPETSVQPTSFPPGVQVTADMRITLVEWRIKKGREQDFLDYWSRQATLSDRSGLVGEYLTRLESPEQFPFAVWEFNPRWTTFVNVGIWRSFADYHQQVGRFIDLNRPPLEFEAEPRRRLLMVPARWRVGGTPLGREDSPGVR